MKLSIFHLYYYILVFITTLQILLWKLYQWGSWTSVSYYNLTKDFEAERGFYIVSVFRKNDRYISSEKLGDTMITVYFHAMFPKENFNFHSVFLNQQTKEKVKSCLGGWEWLRQRRVWSQSLDIFHLNDFFNVGISGYFHISFHIWMSSGSRFRQLGVCHGSSHTSCVTSD